MFVCACVRVCACACVDRISDGRGERQEKELLCVFWGVFPIVSQGRGGKGMTGTLGGNRGLYRRRIFVTLLSLQGMYVC